MTRKTWPNLSRYSSIPEYLGKKSSEALPIVGFAVRSLCSENPERIAALGTKRVCRQAWAKFHRRWNTNTEVKGK